MSTIFDMVVFSSFAIVLSSLWILFDILTWTVFLFDITVDNKMIKGSFLPSNGVAIMLLKSVLVELPTHTSHTCPLNVWIVVWLALVSVGDDHIGVPDDKLP